MKLDRFDIGVVVGMVVAVTIVAVGQPSPPHVSAITPPPIPEMPVTVHHVTNLFELHGVPIGSDVSVLQMGSMQLVEVVDVWRTNRHNCYIVLLSKPEEPSGQLMSAPGVPMLLPEDIAIISNYHRGNNKVIIVPEK
jgi:hypothetical protein